MKLVLISGCAILSMLVASGAMAQSTSTVSESLPASDRADGVTLSTSTAPKSRWQMALSSENSTGALDQKVLGSKAPVVSTNAAGLVYTLNPLWAVELREYFEYASNAEALTGRTAQMHEKAMESGPTLLRLAAKPTWGIAGSKPLTAEFRYYLPNDRVSRENKEAGLLRADAYAEWMMSPRYSFAFWASPRVLLNTAQNPNAIRGADAEYYEMKLAPFANYYFNDNVNAYVAYTLSGRSTGAQRGHWIPDAGNVGSPELGMFWVAGAFTVNPALTSDTNLNSADGSILTRNSRVFAEETLSYNFNLYATF